MAKRRSNGEGSIVKNMRNGIQIGWRASITIGTDDKGKLVRKQFTGKTQQDVKNKLQEYKKQMLMGVLNEDKLTVSDWFYSWLFDYRKQDLKPKSFQRYHGIYKNYIENTDFGNIKLNDLRTTHLQRHYKKLLDNGITPTTIRQINTNLKTCLNEAERQGYIQKNWCKLVTLPKKEDNKEVKVFTKEEQEKFLEAIKGHELELLYIVALGTGLRIGEILGLKWSDIDFKNNELHVNRSLQKAAIYEDDKIVRYEVQETTPKTKNSLRTIPVPQNIIKKLRTHKNEQNELILLLQEEYNNKNYVFCNKLGRPIEDKRPGRNLKTILTSIGIEPIKFHALRHTYATRLFEAGIPPKTVQHLMGHSDIETTMNIYTHVMKEQKLEAVDKINSIFA
ncbi:tyrosine-type recombinase/integrase [Terrisporobacter mayombei]|uniref:Tyrosine recombinase XerC n=1 Tax=Terrisporobacter mayombei TaxID=1541 RepID=A0ABY9Q6Q5_9FIRM|nr:site-specific integrase [Terrisporobacter mayombei]MCC3868937.1 site-specific integrase [Terrisporobacter mayombei]WMT82929.1 Tyrosine recombinase XerC [Terrisporobacter mayombei]